MPISVYIAILYIAKLYHDIPTTGTIALQSLRKSVYIVLCLGTAL